MHALRLAFVALSLSAAVTTAEEPAVYELAAGAAIPLLPEQLRELFARHETDFRRGCAPRSPSETSARRKVDQRHYVCLDAGAAADPSLRSTEFPRRRLEAKRLYDEHAIADGGWLPWSIEEEFTGLVDAFKTGDPQQTAEQAGILAHFAIDAALPFNTTGAERIAESTRQTHIPAENADRESLQADEPASMRRRDRFHGTLVDRLRERLAFEVRVAPQRARPAGEPLQASFDVLLAAHGAASRLIAIDAQLIDELGAKDVPQFVASSDIYWEKLAERAAPILEEQIESGALLAANLIAAAWIQAGRPGVDSPIGATDAASEPAWPTVATAPPAEPTTVAGPFVGSIGSTTYHRSTCAHCARIKPDNITRFATARDAEAAGRKPCRVCRPDQP